MGIKLFFAWYDIWVGLFIDTKKKAIYLCPIPCVVIKFYWGVWYTVEYDENNNITNHKEPNISRLINWIKKKFKRRKSNNE